MFPVEIVREAVDLLHEISFVLGLICGVLIVQLITMWVKK